MVTTSIMAEPIVGKKESDRARTIFYTTNGEQLQLFPGKLWVQIVPLALDIRKVLIHQIHIL